jgi:alpha-L-fucosidase
VKTPYTLLDLYYKSVGKGANLDLGLSPNQDGLLDEEDVASLQKFGAILKETFATNLAKGATLQASNIRGKNSTQFGPRFLLDNNRYSYWATDETVKTPELTLDLGTEKTFNVIRLRENIKIGQRIEAFKVEIWKNESWQQIASATSIGANRLIRLPQNVTAQKVRLRITKSPVCIALSDFGLYKEPVHLSAPIIRRDKNGMVSITTDAPVSALHYTIDGSLPTINSPSYTTPFLLENGGLVRAVAMEGKQTGEVSSGQFGLSKSGWKVMETDAASKPQNAVDEDQYSLWSTLKKDSTQQFTPGQISIDLGKTTAITAFTYLPRQDKKLTGTIDQYAFYTSKNGTDWEEVTNGEFSNIRANPINQVVQLPHPVTAQFIRFVGKHSVNGNGITAAEIGIISTKASN